MDILEMLEGKQNKYKNKKITIDGHTFQSIKEGNHYCELKIRLRVGEITDLKLQPPFVICPAVQWNGRRICAKKYVADFQYKENGEVVVVDVKGKRTAVYQLKKSLFLSQYPEYTFREV